MFRITKPDAAQIDRMIQQVLPVESGPVLLDPLHGLKAASPPVGFSHDLLRTELGSGRNAFSEAVHAFQQWQQFDLGWVRVANQTATIELCQIVAVEVYSIGLWSVNLSRIVSVTRETGAFGFIYRTTPNHVEEGEERFTLTLDPDTERIHYELEAVSRPRHWMASLAYPLTRAFQHRFARGSHDRMRKAVSERIH